MGEGGATIADGGFHHDLFLFDRLPGGRWAAAALALVGWLVLHQLLKQRRRRAQLRRRREIRARLHAARPTTLSPPVGVTTVDVPTVADIDLTDPEPVVEIDLRDRVVYGSVITLESGDTLETGIVGPD